MKNLFAGSLFIILFISGTNLFPQEFGEKFLLPFEKILSIMENSEIIYEPEIVDTSKPERIDYQTLHNRLYINYSGDAPVIAEYDVSEEALLFVSKAEDAYQKKKYDDAINFYRKALEEDEEYHGLYTLIGDMFYMKEQYDSAEYFFKYAISKNFIDYNAHWFLADTYSHTGQYEKGFNELLIAHLVNRNHENIFKMLKQQKSSLNEEWSDWELEPYSLIYKIDDRIIIRTTEDWLGYAFAEAVWKNEPGFAGDILGEDYDDNKIYFEKEAGCIVANIGADCMAKVRQIMEDGYFPEMIWYEIISRKAPHSILLLPEELLERIKDYLKSIINMHVRNQILI